MKKVSEILENPSGLDSMSNYLGDVPEDCWLSLLTHNRDSDLLTESNWDCALKRLGGESENVKIFRFGHWACGWWESLGIRKDSPQEKEALAIEKKIDAYPVLDENDWSEREDTEAQRIWTECYNTKERIEYIREHENQFSFHDFQDLISNVRGKWFSGYASELVG